MSPSFIKGIILELVTSTTGINNVVIIEPIANIIINTNNVFISILLKLFLYFSLFNSFFISSIDKSL